MGTTIGLTGLVKIDGWRPSTQTFTGTGDGTLQTFTLDLTGLDAKVLSVTSSCLSADSTTLYPSSVALNENQFYPYGVSPTASVQVPTGVDFVLSVGYIICS